MSTKTCVVILLVAKCFVVPKASTFRYLILNFVFPFTRSFGLLLVNVTEVAGVYSGVLFGIANTIATLNGIFGPTVISAITADVSSYQYKSLAF